MWLIVPAFTIVGGVILALVRFGKYESPRWVLNAFLMAGLASVAYGALSLLLHRPFSAEVLQLIAQIKTWVGGVVVGMLVTIALAGELNVSKRRRQQSQVR